MGLTEDEKAMRASSEHFFKGDYDVALAEIDSVYARNFEQYKTIRDLKRKIDAGMPASPKLAKAVELSLSTISQVFDNVLELSLDIVETKITESEDWGAS